MELNVLYYCGKYGEMQIFFGEDLTTPISIVSLNDADWRHEYLNPIMEKIGVTVYALDEDDFADDAIELIVSNYFGY